MADQLMELEFTKLSGAGNDFIVINNMDLRVPEEGRRQYFNAWCHRGMAVGADGVLLIEPADQDSGAHFRMRYYNADGGEAETCGNGSRCIARFAYIQGVAPRQMIFQTLAGTYSAEVLENDEVRVQMSDAFGLRENIELSGDTFAGTVDFVNTGVPHVVVMVDDLENTDVIRIGRHLRQHPEFAPAGTNVNFVKAMDQRSLDVRTYERGVETETLACGTGCIASSIVAVRKNLVATPIHVKTAGGETLGISFTLTDDGARNVTLQGSAHIIYRGFIPVDKDFLNDPAPTPDTQFPGSVIL